MDPKDYYSSTAGKPIRHLNGYWYFLPYPLPPDLTWSPAFLSTLSDAERNLGKLAGIAIFPAWIELLVGSFIRREAVVSTRIEGTRASISDLYAYEAEQLAFLEPSSDVEEVHNYVQALRYGLERLDQLPVSLRLIRELHAILMQGVRGQHLTPGEFRHSQNWIGPAWCTLNDAPYVPPPVDEMRTALQQLETFIHMPTNLPALVRIGLIHYQFEAIHPFLDGNGRMGRLLISLLLHDWKLLPQPLLYLSAYFEADRKTYYERLLAVSQMGEWEAWLHYFVHGVNVQALDAIQRISILKELFDGYSQRLRTERAAGKLMEVVNLLFGRPIITIRQIEASLGVSYRTAARYVERLVQLGILREITGQTRNRIFQADEILYAIERPLTNR